MKHAAFTIIVTFGSIILIGTCLLLLPFSVNNGNSLTFHDAFFTATSAVTVTGLIVEDTNSYFTLFGKIVILILIQFGGLGFMTFSTLIILLLGKSISINDRIIIENDFTSGNYSSIKSIIKKIFTITFIFELTGFVLFFLQFKGLKSGERIFLSLFHSISGFCNAGFSLFSTSFEKYSHHWGINLTLMFLIILGGLGFLVLSEIGHFFSKKKETCRLSLHSKIVLITSSILIIGGALIFFLPNLMTKNNDLSLSEQVLTSLFQSVTARTAGFHTLNQLALPPPAILFTILLMFIGASPGSTGGGIKTSTIGMIFLKVKSKFQRDKKVHLFYRSIPDKTIEKAFVIFFISILIIFISFLLMIFIEKNISFDKLLFEVVSAFGTVGLSMGITSKLTIASKIILIITMFIGRIGPLTLLIAICRPDSKSNIDYAREDIMIG